MSETQNVIRIDDPDDPRVAPYRDIRERDLVGRQRRFIAEGKVVLDVLLSQPRFALESLLVLENRVAGLAGMLARVPPAVPIHVAATPVLDAIAGFPMHRGVLALARRPGNISPASLIAEAPPLAVVVILVGIANHDNVGSIFRNAAAFGAHAVLLDPTCCDPLYRKAIRVSVGGVFKVPFARFEATSELVALFPQHGFRMLALSPRGTRDISELRPGGRTALFLGTEGGGLPPALLGSMQTARIAMAPGFDSLNVAAASAIALHRLSDAGASG